MAEYIERESLLVGIGSPESGLDDIINTLIFEHNLDFLHDYDEDEIRVFAKDLISNVRNYIQTEPTADVVKVVRCKDCIYFQPDFVLSNDGERRPYTQEEKESGFGYVSIDKGINCGSRCERHGYWEENKIPVWFNENDYCSYGERKDGE